MRRLPLLLSVFLFAACERHETKTEAAAPASIEQRLPDGGVVIPADSPKLKELRVEEIQEAEAPVAEVVSPGQIETNPNRVAHITLPVAGRIAGCLVKIGDSVQRGQAVLTIESPDADAAESAWLQAQAGLTQARANLNKAQTDYDRSADLFQHNAVARKDVLTNENALAQAKAAQEQAQAALEQASRRLELLGLKAGSFGQKVTVNSPISGKVLEMAVVPGEYRNDTNASLITIADLSTVWVSSDVPESQIRFIQSGERIDVNLTAYPGETFHGRVTRISDTVDPQTRSIKVHAEMDNSHGRLRPEMFCTIRHTEAVRKLPVAPATAVVQEGGRTIVWTQRGPGHFQPVEVKTDGRLDNRIAIVSGLRVGDRVVVDGAMLLRAQ